MLEFQRLLLQKLNLPLRRILLDLSILNGQSRILEVRLCLQQVSVCLGVLLLLFLVSVDPHVPRLLLVLDLFTKLGNFFATLLFGKFKLTLNSLFLDLNSFHLSLELNNFFVHFLDLNLAFLDRFFLQPDDVLKRAVALNLIGQLRFEIMARLVHLV